MYLLTARKAVVLVGKAYLLSCTACGSWTYFPRPSAARQAQLHDNAEYFEHPYFQLRREIVPVRRCRYVFRHLAALSGTWSLQGERVLDIGCDTGNFLKVAQQEAGIVPVGIDVSARAVGVAREQGIDAYHTALESAPAHLTGFRIVTAIDLIEHVTDPAAFLREAGSRMLAGGMLYLETPNIQSSVYGLGRILSALMRGADSALLERLFPPQHVHYFTPNSLRGLAYRCGFEVAAAGTRVLPAADLQVSAAAMVPIQLLQALDRLFQREILVWTVLRKQGQPTA
jgi:SAM-dependent methyltransferase